MKIPIYVAVAATLLVITACQPNLPAGTIVAVPSQPPPLPPPPPPPPIAYQPSPAPQYDVYVKGPRGNWAQKRCPIGQHWKAGKRVTVVAADGTSMSRVKRARCVPN